MTGKIKVASVVNLTSAVENYRAPGITRVEVDQIVTIPGHNPRGFATGERAFQGPEFEALKRSIEELGDVFQPVLLRPKANSNLYELVAGERRFRAAKALGLHTISALVRPVSDDEAYRLAREENELRENVAKIDQLFSSLHQLAARLGVTVNEVRRVLIRARDAQAQGKPLPEDGAEARALELIEKLWLPKVATLVRSSRLLDLLPDERQALREGLSEAAALALLDLGDHPARPELLRRALDEGWSAKRMAAEVKAVQQAGEVRPRIGSLVAQTRKVLSDARVRKLSLEQQQEVERALEEFMARVQAITGARRE